MFYGTAAGSASTELLAIIDVGGIGKMCSDIDVTHNGLATALRTYIPGLQDGEPIECEYLYNATNYAAVDGIFGASHSFKIQFPDMGNTTASTITCDGYINKHTTESKMNEAIKGKFQIKPTTAVTFTAAT